MRTTHRRLVVGPIVVVLVSMTVVPVVPAADEATQPNAFRELQLGYLALDQGDFESAVAHYSRALELAPGDEQRFNALFGLGSAALELNRLDEARTAFEQAHRLKPGEAGATFMLGVSCRRLGDLDAAVTFLAEAAVRDPALTQALVELGIAYAAQERHGDAERICREALARDPDNLEAQIGLAVALFHQDEFEASVAEFRRALELGPDDLRAHYGLGLALAFSGDRDGAVEEIIYLNSRSPELAADLHRWVTKDGN